MSKYIGQTVLLIGQAFNSVSYSRRMNVMTGVGLEKVKDNNTLKNQASLLGRGFHRTFWQAISEAHGSYS